MRNNQRGSALIIALVIVTLVVVGGAGYSVYTSNSDKSAQQNAAQDTKTPKVNSQSTSEAKTENEDQLLKNYIVSLSAGVEDYWAGNNGRYPSSIDVVRARVNDDSYKDWKSDGVLTKGKPSPSTIYYAAGYTCDPETNLMRATDSRSSAIVVLLVSKTSFCSS